MQTHKWLFYTLLLPLMVSVSACTTTATLEPQTSLMPITTANVLQMVGTSSLQGSMTWVSSLAWSPDGVLLAAGSTGTVHLFEAATGTERMVLSRSSGTTVDALAFHPAGSLIAYYSEGTVQLSDIRTASEPREVSQSPGWVRSLAFSPDGSLLLSGGISRVPSIPFLQLWDTGTGGPVLRFDQSNNVLGVAFSPDGMLVASSGDDGIVRIWDSRSGGLLFELVGHKGHVKGLAFSPNGGLLASGSMDGAVRLWDVPTGTERMLLQDQGAEVSNLSFTPDGSLLAAGRQDGTIHLWDVNSGAILAVITVTATEGSLRSPRINAIAFNPAGTLLAAGIADGIVWLYGVPGP